MSAPIAYGAAGRAEMALDPKLAFLTHGSFTATPRRIMDAQSRYREEIDRNPDRFFRYNWRDMYLGRVELAAEFLGVTPENLVLVPNVTAGTNTVLKSLKFSPDDAILIYSFTYKAVENACKSVASRDGCSIIKVPVPVEIDSKEQVIDMYRDYLEKHANIKLAVLDVLSSPTATVFPVAELVALCRQRGILTLIDAAHMPGQVELDIERLGADFLTGNLHKWVFCPRSAAVLWVDPKHHHVIKPLMTSAVLGADDFRLDFIYTGTLDYTSILCVREGIQMYKDLGGMEKLAPYIDNLLEEAVVLLTKMWGTKRYPIPKDMEAPYMRSVEIPKLKHFPPCPITGEDGFSDQGDLLILLMDRYNIVTGLLSFGDMIVVRMCAQFYNTLEDYQRLGEAILEIKAEEQQV